MPRTLTQFRIFIGSPGGLEEEREAFKDAVLRFNETHGEAEGIVFAPIGWEDTLGGVGRPQELINKDLETCDYAIFLYHDRWGSEAGSGKAGTEEEWALALRLYEKKILWKICLFFKEVDKAKLADPGPQLTKVVEFQKTIEADKTHLFHQYAKISEYRSALERHLASWYRDQKVTSSAAFTSLLPAEPAAPPSKDAAPSFDFWITEGRNLMKGSSANGHGILYCADKATELASDRSEWATAENLRGIALSHLGDLASSIASFEKIAGRLTDPVGLEERRRLATALNNKGLVLGLLGRHEEAVTVYDGVVHQYGAASEVVLREQVAKALVWKAITLSKLVRDDEAITAYDEVVNGYKTTEEGELFEIVARAKKLRAQLLQNRKLRKSDPRKS